MKKAGYGGVLGDKVRSTGFNDIKNSGNDSCLIGPPSVEFAPFQKVPSARPRKDARQSTIDQDPEFIDFLESLTNPITKSSTVDQETESVKDKEKVTITPLIQFLKDKKANKGKEASNTAKGGKHGRQDAKENKGNANAGNKVPPAAASSNKKRSAQAVKVEQAARDAVKVLNKQAAGAKGPSSAPSAAPSSPAAKTITPNITPNSSANAALADKKRERGSASAAAKILQRDLGLGGTPTGRGGRGARGGRTVNAAAAAPNQQQGTAKPDQATAPNTTIQAKSITSGGGTATEAVAPPPEAKPAPAILQKPTAPPTGPAATRASNPSSTPSNPKAALAPPSISTQAFLKHANPSQGITEPLLEEAFAAFGTVQKVEIDKKKGFAYVDFEAAESLQQAIKASPIKVAQGQVVVLERKTGPNSQTRNGGGGGGGRGGSPMGGSRGGGGGGGGGTPMNARGGNANARGGSMRGRGGGGNRGAGTKTAPAASNPSPAAPAAAQAVAASSPAPSKAAENSAPPPSEP